MTLNWRDQWQRMGNGAILGFLILLAVWGHFSHWQIPQFGSPKGHRQSAQHPALENPALGEDLTNGGDDRGSSPIARSPDHREIEAAVRPSAREDGQKVPGVHFPSAEAIRKAGIRVEAARLKELDECVLGNGVVAYDETRMARLSARVPGIAWRVEKQLGDRVQKGDILAILDSGEVGKAKAEFLETVVAFDVKTQNLKRLEMSTSSVPERQVREAKGQLREARIRQFNAQQRLINLGLPVPMQLGDDLSDEELSRKIQFLGIPGDVVAGLDSEAATANLIPLVAPFDGVLISREIVAGEFVQTAHPQFIIADVSRMWLKLNIKNTDAIRLAIGQTVWFVPDGVPGEVECRLAWIGTEVDEKTRTVQVRAEIDNPLVASPARESEGQRLLRAHTFGTGRICVREQRQAVVVPSGAIQWDGTNHLVFIPQADGLSFLPRLVTPGVSREGYTEISHGVTSEESVVSSGSHVLKSEVGRRQTAAIRP